MIFKKKNYFEYYFKDPFFDKEISEERVKHYLEESTPKSSGWWKTLKIHIDMALKFRSHIDYLKNYQTTHLEEKTEGTPNPLMSLKTAKSCPAIIDVLSNSLLLKSPVDIVFTISSDERYVWNSSQYDMASPAIDIVTHDKIQLRTYGNNDIFKNKMNIKFIFPMYVKSNTPYIFLPPTYHNPDFPFQVLPGTVTKRWMPVELNTNTMIDVPKKGTKSYHIKKGEVIGYLWFPEKTKLRWSKKRFQDGLITDSWGSGRKSWGK